MIGQTISHYNIIEKLGEGGMGVVFKAEDTKLRRTVALKFLSQEAVESEETKQRLIREAQAAGALDHPNICTAYGIHEEEGYIFIAMAYVEGPSVAEKIKQRPLPLEEAISIAIQTAEGLQEAHDHGVIHRDIKSANVMLTPKGQVKITDFGLAQLAGRTKLTKSGTKLGTPAYMSPEQALGQATDRRTDIWSLGVVLYEMLTGQLPFRGDYDQVLLYSVVNEEPEPVTALRSGLPAELDRILRKALAKRPAERYQHADDMLVDLRALRSNRASQKPTAALPAASGGAPARPGDAEAQRAGANHAEAPARGRERLAWLIAAVCFAAMLLLAVLYFGQTQPGTPQAPLRRFSFTPPVGLRSGGEHPNIAVSPDGRQIVFTAHDESRLWLHQLDLGTSRPLEGTEGADDPFWSPGSDFIGYFAGAQIKAVSARGGVPIRVYRRSDSSDDVGGDDSRLKGGTWSPDGNSIVFSEDGRLYEVPARGGAVTLIVSPEEPEQPSDGLAKGPTGLIRWPHFLPLAAGGRVLAYTFGSTAERTLMVHDLESGRRESLGPGELAFYSPSGHLLYQLGPTTYDLWALPFSLDTLRPTGEAFEVAHNGRLPMVASDQTLVYLDAGGSGEGQLVWRDRQGSRLGTIGEKHTGGLGHPSLSPDGRLVAVNATENGNTDIWIHEVDRPVKIRLTTHEAPDLYPSWSPNADRIAFSSGRTGIRDIYVAKVDGSEDPVPLVQSADSREYPTDWWRDDSILVCMRLDPAQTFYLKRLENPGGYEEVFFLENARLAKLSPDGRFVAYGSDHSGLDEVYIRSFPDGKGQRRVSVNGGSQVRWRKDGKELFYVEGEFLMAVPVSTSPTLEVGSPRRLFSSDQLGFGTGGGWLTYDVTADGRKFVVQERASQRGGPIHIVQNWFSHFKNRLDK